jgi:hypothetical protein
MKYFTGIGSRACPIELKSIIFDLCKRLVDKGYILRSGGADGADSFFEEAYDQLKGTKEIYLPWKNFNDNKSELFKVSKEALELASTIHPVWSYCSFGAKKLHGRNCYQVLGYDLKTPSEFVICWTLDGKKAGGTRTAIVLAEKHNIPVYNLAVLKNLDNILNG